jgi:hypothetical protein
MRMIVILFAALRADTTTFPASRARVKGWEVRSARHPSRRCARFPNRFMYERAIL